MSAFMLQAWTTLRQNLVLQTQHASPCRGIHPGRRLRVPHGCALLSRPNRQPPPHPPPRQPQRGFLPQPIRQRFPNPPVARETSPANHRIVGLIPSPSGSEFPARLLSRGSLERPLYRRHSSSNGSF